MQRIICWAVLALLGSSGAVFAQTTRLPVTPAIPLRSATSTADNSGRNGSTIQPAHHAPRPHIRYIVLHRYHPPFLFPFVVPDATLPPVPYSAPTYTGLEFVNTSPAYVFVGSNSPTRPQLVFKDGTSYAVSDYWRVDNELHFVTVEEGGTKSVPRTVPFDNLDVQRTKDTAAAQGFRFVVRDEPIEQWLEHRGTRAGRHKGTAK